MDTLPPIKKPLAALAKKSISRPKAAPNAPQAPAQKSRSVVGGGKTEVREARPSFEALDLQRVEKPVTRQSAPVSQEVTTPKAQAPLQLSDQPQLFTLQSLSAMAGVLVAALEGEGSAPSAPNTVDTKTVGDDSPQGEANVAAKRPGSKINFSV